MRKVTADARPVTCGSVTRAGMSLVEVLIAISILLVLLGTMIPALLATAALNTRNDQVSVGVRLATVVLENYRAQLGGSSPLPLSGTVTSGSVVNGQAYSVAAVFCPADAPAGMVCSAKARYIRVIVSNSSAVPIYTAESYFTELK